VPTASYPNFARKHAGEAMFTAADLVAYLRQAGAADEGEVSRGAVLCHQPSLYDRILRAEELTPPRRQDFPVALPSTGGHLPAQASRSRGQLMQRGPPRPRPSSPPGTGITSMSLSCR
jgi:hypothetical protein